MVPPAVRTSPESGSPVTPRSTSTPNATYMTRMSHMTHSATPAATPAVIPTHEISPDTSAAHVTPVALTAEAAALEAQSLALAWQLQQEEQQAFLGAMSASTPSPPRSARGAGASAIEEQ